MDKNLVYDQSHLLVTDLEIIYYGYMGKGSGFGLHHVSDKTSPVPLQLNHSSSYNDCLGLWAQGDVTGTIHILYATLHNSLANPELENSDLLSKTVGENWNWKKTKLVTYQMFF